MKNTNDPLAGLRQATSETVRKRFVEGIRTVTLSRRARRLGGPAPGAGGKSHVREAAVRVAVAAAVAAALTFTVSGRLPWHTLRIEAGKPAPEDVWAPRTGRWVNEEATAELQEKAAASVPKVYQADVDAQFDTLSDIETTFATLRAALADRQTPVEERISKLQPTLPLGLSRRALTTCLTLPEAAALDAIESQARRWIEDTYARFPLHDDTDDVAQQRKRLLQECDKLPWPDSRKQVLREVITRSLRRPNLLYDADATAAEREAARRRVPPVVERIRKGEQLLHKGALVSEADLGRLEAVGLYTRRSSASEVASTFGLIVCLLLFLGVYLRRYVPEVWKQTSLWVLLGGLLVLGALIYKLGLQLSWPTHAAVPVVATTGMLLSVLLDAQLAVLAAAMLALLLGAMGNTEVWGVTVAWTSALVGIYGVGELQSRAQLVKTGGVLAVANVLLIAASGTLLHTAPEEILAQVGFGAVAGIACAIFTLGGAMFLERPFGLTTDLRLLELANPNEPILRRLLLEAPGTYHASLIIANLAETAAETVGADSLLVRTGCYYHDIGKIRRPYLFVENQFGGENPHDHMAPSLSVLAIQAHVKEGLEIGRSLHLPQPVLDIIAQHHGTTLVSFFYRQALTQQVDGPPEESNFRYPGPKPQTREAAIVMLADGVEAAVRALATPTPNAVEERIHKIITDRLEDGQLNECDLTLRDLEVIEKTFVRLMLGILHKRIEYPPTEPAALSNSNRKAGNGTDGRRSQPHAASR